jgi:iron complex outermembrane recepter protein
MRRLNLKSYLLGGVVLAGFAPTLALAEQAATVTTNATAAATAATETPSLEVVVVTATKRETKLQDTPIAISVMGTQTLKDRHVQSMSDLADGGIPSLRVATFEARSSALTVGMRGIVPTDANQPAREAGVGIYIDGVYLGRSHGLGAALLDIDRVEVLKGPQGTLFGRNTTGGAVNIITKSPSGQFAMRTTAGFGNFGSYNLATHIDFPTWNDFSVKIDAVSQARDATIENPLSGQEGWNKYDRRGGRLAVRYEPSDSFSALYAYDAGLDVSTPFYSQLLNYNPQNRVVGPATGTLPAGQIRPLPRAVLIQTDRAKIADIGVPQQDSVGNTSGHMLRLNWQLGENLDLRSITAYRTVKQSQWDNGGGAHRPPAFVAGAAFSRYSISHLDQNQISQEFDLIGKTERIDYVAGIYYFSEEAGDDASTPSTNIWNADGTSSTLATLFTSAATTPPLDRKSNATSRSSAVFGQFTWNLPILSDAVKLTLGGRYTQDEKSGNLLVVNGNLPVLPSPTGNVVGPIAFKANTNRFNPLVTVSYDVNTDIHLYAKYATAYRSGGANSRSLTYAPFGPEDVTTFEIGAKTEFFDRRLRLNAAAFSTERKNSQIDFTANIGTPFILPGTTTTIISNRNTVETRNAPGKSEISGFELDATFAATDNLTLSASYANTNTKVPPTLNPFTNTIQPVFIVFTPENAWSGALDYKFEFLGATGKLHLDAAYADATQTFEAEAIKNDKSTIVNGRLALSNIDLGDSKASLEVALWARNLLDEAHVYRRSGANDAVLGTYGNFNEPRTFGLEATVKY